MFVKVVKKWWTEQIFTNCFFFAKKCSCGTLTEKLNKIASWNSDCENRKGRNRQRKFKFFKEQTSKKWHSESADPAKALELKN